MTVEKDVCDGFAAEAVSNGLFGPIIAAFKCLLLWILRLVGLLLNLAVVLMQWIISTDAMNGVLKNKVVYDIWKMVRDTLNIAFIMTLLFSAFATILQIERYNYKRILLNLVIMALLVNFSYPITLFIIDVSNVIMYYFVNHLLGNGTGGVSNILKDSLMAKIISGTKMSDDALMIISAIVFTFIMTFTVLAIGIMLLIRLVALTILVIFSSVAYVGSVVPGTKLASAASGWWSNLMEQAFFGPIMIFMIYIAAKLLQNMSSVQTSINNTGVAISGGSMASYVSKIAFFLIPIAILWMGLMSAKKSSAAGAGIMMGFAMKASKGVPRWTANKTGVPGAAKKAWDNGKKNNPLWGTEKVAEREARLLSITPGFLGGDKTALRDLKRKKVNEKLKTWKDDGASEKDIWHALETGKPEERMAAAMKMAEDGKFDKNYNTAFNQYLKAREAVQNDPAFKESFDSKIKKENVRFNIDYQIRNEGKNPTTVYQDTLGKMSAGALSKQGRGLHDDIESNPHMKAFIENKYSTVGDDGTRTLNEKKLNELYKNLSANQQTAYERSGFNPNVRPRTSRSSGRGA